MDNTRKLAAIMVADIVGYSRLAGADEDRTLARLRGLRSDLIDPAIAAHHGRIVKRTGDGSIVEFRSVVDAVRCSIEVQTGMVDRNAGLPAERRIEFRVGVHVGDVVEESDGDLMGDGVNIAARLEGVANPGGICLSEDAYRQVKHRLDIKVSDLGLTQLKNIAEPIQVFSLEVGQPAVAKAASPTPTQTASTKSAAKSLERAPVAPATRRRWIAPVLTGLVVLAVGGLAVVDGIGWLRASRQHAPDAYSPQDRRQSIMVVPFENGSTNPAQDDVAATVTRELNDIFERTGDPLVPAAVAATYRGKVMDLRRIGREHDVHFVLMGNSRQQDRRLIVSAVLYETAHGNRVWGERYERADETEKAPWVIASLIRQDVDQATMDEEARSALREHPDQLDKRDLMFAAYASNLSRASKSTTQAQIALVERALALDPNYVWALRAKGRRYADLVNLGFSDDPARDAATAAEAVDRALQLAPNDYQVLKEKTYVLRAQGKWLEAEALTRRLLELRPRVSARHENLGSILMAQGRNSEALASFLDAKQLQVATDNSAELDANIAAALLANGRFQEAIEQARLAIPEFTAANGRIAELPWLVLIAAESARGKVSEARADLKRFLAVPRSWNTITAIRSVAILAANPMLLQGLQDAGMPVQ